MKQDRTNRRPVLTLAVVWLIIFIAMAGFGHLFGHRALWKETSVSAVLAAALAVSLSIFARMNAGGRVKRDRTGARRPDPTLAVIWLIFFIAMAGFSYLFGHRTLWKEISVSAAAAAAFAVWSGVVAHITGTARTARR